MKKIILLTIGLTLYITANSQIIGGDIRYVNIGSTQLGFYIDLYIEGSNSPDYINVNWGDGNIDSIPWISITTLPDNILKCTYFKVHSFPSELAYTVSIETSHWSTNIDNIPNPYSVQFSLYATVYINPYFNYYNSPLFLEYPIASASAGSTFFYNTTPYDEDGDSITYEIVNCYGSGLQEINGYQIPSASNSLNIVNGFLKWDTPVDTGLYAIALIVKAYRQGIIIDEVLRQITVNVKSPTSVNNIDLIECKVYPNPVIDNLTIEGLKEDDLISIYNIMGNKINYQVSHINTSKISLSGISGGIYFIRIERGSEIKVFKILKQ